MNSVQHTQQTLAAIITRLQGRVETRPLAREVEEARASLLAIHEAVAAVQRESEESLDTLIQHEDRLNVALSDLTSAIQKSSSAMYVLRVFPGGFLAHRAVERFAKIRQLLLLVEGVSLSVGLAPLAARLRQALFAVEDGQKRRASLLVARSSALQERAQALRVSKRLLQRLLLQTKLLFPSSPSLTELESRVLLFAA